jgi:DNA-binding NarL/FixJ family response regulator
MRCVIVRKHTGDPRHQLTSQRDRIARPARTGMSSRQIAALLFLSARTVRYRLRKVFTKQKINSATISGKRCPTAPAPG